jgi:hypothetical protein
VPLRKSTRRSARLWCSHAAHAGDYCLNPVHPGTAKFADKSLTSRNGPVRVTPALADTRGNPRLAALLMRFGSNAIRGSNPPILRL